ncbi:MAG TPA: amino acid ABC transporter substrate-binding protein [Candidatus Sulfotelmatobacter sp.]|jgi:general L-amino acid transport system substrate-binding protein|nr:amino acid ABC transporter substrate-binding protein [Candidatus Sulfotelmatobacter sp.]
MTKSLFFGLLAAVAVLTSLLWLQPAQAGPTLDAIKARGVVQCGANVLPGYAAPDAQGQWTGIMVDLCRALAAATLGDAGKIDIVPIESLTRFNVLAAGNIDVLADGATITLERETRLNLAFPAIYLYDGQSFLAHHSLHLKSIRDLKSGTVCVADGTTSQRNLAEFVLREHMSVRILPTQSDQGVWQSYLKGRCDVMTGDRFALLARLALDAQNPNDHDLLPEVISKEPIGPAVRSDDPQWIKLVRWTVFALIAAEEHGLTSANIDKPAEDGGAEVDILTGKSRDYAESLGVAPGWAKRIIRQVGNYGEIFTRHFGAGSPMKGERGINAPWTQGGLIYAPPLR